MLHRYVGIVMGLLMLLWFLSGIVMLFVHWPEVTDEERAAGLPPVAWGQCCVFGDIQEVIQVERATVEDLAGRSVLRFDNQVLDLTTGQPIHRISSDQAARVAQAYATAHGIGGKPGTPEAIARDQWTVTGYFNKRRPFYLFHFDDPARTDIYVSAHTGAVSQVVNAREKVLNWLGPIPHWLYPEVLRADVKLWAQVVNWTSLVGIFLTVTGLYLGVISWRPWGGKRVTPYRGLMAWHHLTGLFAGILTLTWVASGLVSMNPWGFLDSPGDPRGEQVTGAFAFGDLREAVTAARVQGVTARQITAAPLGGTLYLMADGVRLDAQARPAVLAPKDLAAAAGRLGPALSAGLITQPDAYYYDGHDGQAKLPAYRVELQDKVRFYLDPASGQVLAQVDGPGRAFRWLFTGLHRLDVINGLRGGAPWYVAMVVLLVFAGAGVATGVWLGWRRAKSDLGQLTKRKAPKLR
ncbi:MAG: PepSY domain-containing protein [Alphaproteobacteria bacterium]|nr:PepSY domain-containing protein [Alphaproteobacteria bacterium]MBU1517225.1 PepSY domain-containing protein [Alphaproteobacteria bacterium]MBU2093239.1 PepSY domain-containing protein [Alphaproteobacteria bacterium]MBU2153135.1 PepSY domain-containing protein [Alphaproteobacteria bacterium]MBU2307841.1 PepSY domain-containing protein [Alphaproteobacteria bacterium]